MAKKNRDRQMPVAEEAQPAPEMVTEEAQADWQEKLDAMRPVAPESDDEEEPAAAAIEEPTAAPDTAVPDTAAPLSHEAGPERCSLANHGDGHGHCVRCLHCKKKVRPQHLSEPCPARN